MSEMATNASSDDTLVRDCQLSGFSAFRERVGFCCCRLFKKSSKYDLSSASKTNEEEQDDKPSYDNQAFQIEKQARQAKLERIAKTLPGATFTGIQGIQTPPRSETPRSLTSATPRSLTSATPRSLTSATPRSLTSATPRSLTSATPRSLTSATPRSLTSATPRSLTSATPRSGIGLVQSRSPVSKTGISTINRPSPLAANTKNKKKDPDETVTEDSSEEESSSEDGKSSNSDTEPAKPVPAKPVPAKQTKSRR